MSPLDPSIVERENAMLAPYAMHSAASAGRKHAEPPHPYRSPFQRDRDRIVHSTAFRRLAHKTQVFTGELGDYHRTRLTHTLEVSSIARTIGRALRLNEDLIEALALMHDLGHPPFGHAGEDALDKCVSSEGGFNHNRQALRIVELIEARYPDFPGLNLTREVLSGQASRGPHDAESPAGRLLEAQIVDAADSIAYDAHDADDAVELGLLQLDELRDVELWQAAGRHAERRYGALDAAQFRRAAVHELIDLLASDVLRATSDRIARIEFSGVSEVLRHGDVVVAPSVELAPLKAQLETCLFRRVYRHADVLREREQAAAALEAMFGALMEQPERLPALHRERAKRDGLPRATADYLAEMTDRFAWDEHRRLCLAKTASDW